ncbi:MAG: hypothetical protein U0235_11575 [Polyangiaceae bacterium]
MGAADPRVTGDWDGYFAARSEALLPLSDERDRVRRELGQIEQSNSPGDIARAEELAYRERVLSANMETTTPSFLSRSGDFEPGATPRAARAQGIDARCNSVARAAGLPRSSTPRRRDRAYDEQMAALSPEARRAAAPERAGMAAPRGPTKWLPRICGSACPARPARRLRRREMLEC